MSKLPLFLLLGIFLLNSVLAIEILDPRDGTTVLRDIEEQVTISLDIPPTATICYYTHFKTPETDIFFSCGDKSFTTNVTYFGLHEIEVYAESSNQYSYDTLSFYIEPKNPQALKETEAPLNLDTFVCLEGSKCVWDDQTFLEIGFLMAIVIMVILAFYGGQQNEKDN